MPKTMQDASGDLLKLLNTLRLDPARTIKIPSGGGGIDRPLFDVMPEDFLDRAEEDQLAGGASARLNAITNAKRAIHSQLDHALLTFGYDIKSIGIEAKIIKLGELGFVAPFIFRRVNVARNLLEHEYRAPSQEEVDEAVAIAALCVEAIGRRLDSVEYEFSLGHEDEITPSWNAQRELRFGYNDKTKVFQIAGEFNKPDKSDYQRGNIVGRVEVPPASPVHAAVVRLILAADVKPRVRKSILNFFSVAGYDGPATNSALRVL